ncbi:Protein phophatase 2c family protein [Mycena venus]|uniref:Protein phophatase 2c family protein n=1 Tax=Mycena venus TaxID=2733690 RepID=A0A8H6YC62_9AGAR|nr:Protein phophatase 2c family protein [Mycena venus]
MASDGLWDCLTNEEVVGLVGLWLERNDNGVSNMPLHDEERVIERADLPVELTDDKTHYPDWPGAKKQFVNVDSNVARHFGTECLGRCRPRLACRAFVYSRTSCSLV